MVSVSSKTQTFTNGTPNDAGPVDSEFVAAFNNDATLAAAVTAIEGGSIITGTTLTLNSAYTGGTPGNMAYMVERGTQPNTGFRWNETDDLWQVTHDGTNYVPLGYTPVNAQVGTTYTVLASDNHKWMTFSNGSAVAVTLPQANTSGFGVGFMGRAINLGAGTVTITPTTSTIGGAASVALATGQSVEFVSDGTNYIVGSTQNVLAATQAQQETGSSTAVYTSPGTQQYHTSASKAWVMFNGTGTVAILASYNVSSITDNGTGDYTVNFTTSFSSANYGIAGICQRTNGNNGNGLLGLSNSANPTASACRVTTADAATGFIDSARVSLTFFGDL